MLASASEARARLLRAAGLAFAVDPARIDEGALKSRYAAVGADAETCALALAEAKAWAVAWRHPGALVIGADQVLECGGAWFDNPASAAAAAAQLGRLQGRRHRLVSAVAVVRDGAVAWRVADAARLTMRRLGRRRIERYLEACGPEALASVGAYRLEGLGVHLFPRVHGDYFTVLGLPLLPLLAWLRRAGVTAGGAGGKG